MKQIILAPIILFYYIAFSQPCFAGPLFPPCYAACIAGCELIFAASGVAVAGVGAIATAAAGLPACLEGCVAACASFCFSSSTTLIVLENGVGVKKSIALVRDGDLVSTFVDGKLVWTKVVKNTKTEGTFRFVQINAKSLTTGELKQITITPNHAMIMMRDNNILTTDAAEHIAAGDNLIALDGNTLSVTEVNNLMLLDKYTLETADGSVIASDIFTTTICSEEVAGGEYLWGSKIEDWKVRHANFTN